MLDGNQKSEVRYQRVSPLAHAAVQGRFGADKGAPGVALEVRHPVSIVTIIARKDKAVALSAAIGQHYGVACPPPGRSAQGKGVTLHWCGAEQWYAVGEGYGEGALYRELKSKLAGLASCSDQSHGRVILTISGPRARNVLTKGTPVDLHPRAFGPGHCAATQMAHVGVHLAQVGPDDFELSLFRGFSESFWEWLTEQAEEFGYLVR
jgi:heterotetrameric sarcosine oxidase gamma subunit